MSKTKKCFKCGEVKPLGEFYKHPQMADGHVNKCKECNKKDVIKNRKEKIVYYKNYDRKRNVLPHRVEARKKRASTDEAKARMRELKSEYRKNNPQKIAARAFLKRYVDSGLLERLPCEICGTRKNIQAHHEDYTKPLDVIWLCPKHHRWIHG